MTGFSKIFLPLGFVFAPSDEELVMFLQVKNRGPSRWKHPCIPEIDICKYEPWDVPEIYAANSVIEPKDSQWYFFCPKICASPNSRRFKRATEKGNWKVTSQDCKINSKSNLAVIGMKITLSFYLRGASSKSVLTSWSIHEFRLPERESRFVLCRLFKKPEQRTSISNVVDSMERNPHTVQNSILSPAPTMLPPDSDTVGASVEPVAQADQNFAVFDLQENVQPLPQTSDMQTSVENYDLLPDEPSNNPSNPDATHVTGSVLSYVAADHEFNETTWVNYLKVNLPEFDDHDPDDFLLTDTGLEFVNYLCDPDECLHDASNAFSSSWKLDPENQSFVCPDISHWDSFLVKEMQTGVVDASKNFDLEEQIFDCPDTFQRDSFSRCIHDDLFIISPTLSDMMAEIACCNSINQNFPPTDYECHSSVWGFATEHLPCSNPNDVLHDTSILIDPTWNF